MKINTLITLTSLAVVVATAGCATCSRRAATDTQPFGTTQLGEQSRLYTLKGKGGLTLVVSDYGGRVVRMLVPDAEGKVEDLTVGFDQPTDYSSTDIYFGPIIGRVGNRIANGKFTLDGKDYKVGCNNAPRHAALHGGPCGWSEYVWDVERFTSGDDVGIVFTRTFPDGENGFPGNVKAKVVYTVTADNTWRIDYEATTDQRTPINLTHHAFFNLDNSDTILDQELMIDADKYLMVDADLKPIGAPRSVEGTPFDFRQFHAIGERIDDPDRSLQHGPGYDHNWCLNGSGFRKVAEMRGKSRRMEIWTDQIGLQFYSGNFINSAWKMKDGRPLHYRSYVALEPQHYPNSVNRPDFPSTVLDPGETYRTTTEYRFR